jgi:hypothetical protein
MTDAVHEFIAATEPAWQADLCRALDALVRSSIPDADARIQYKKPHYLKHKKYAAVIGTAKAFVSFTIFNAAALEYPAGVFEVSDDKSRITVKITEGGTVDSVLLGNLLQQAAAGL